MITPEAGLSNDYMRINNPASTKTSSNTISNRLKPCVKNMFHLLWYQKPFWLQITHQTIVTLYLDILGSLNRRSQQKTVNVKNFFGVLKRSVKFATKNSCSRHLEELKTKQYQQFLNSCQFCRNLKKKLDLKRAHWYNPNIAVFVCVASLCTATK